MERLLEVKIGNVSDALMSRLLPTIQEIITTEYCLDEQSFEQLTETETWAHRALTLMHSFSSSLESNLTSENHAQV